MRLLLLPLLLAAPVLGAAVDPEFGKVTSGNIAAQAGPLPSYAGVPMEGGNGLLAARAVNRYRRGAVKALILPRSSQTGGANAQDRGGGADSGGNGGVGAPQ